MYYGQTAPCMKCTEKFFKCHSVCEKYKQFIARVKSAQQNKKGNQLDMARAYLGEQERAKKVWRGW